MDIDTSKINKSEARIGQVQISSAAKSQDKMSGDGEDSFVKDKDKMSEDGDGEDSFDRFDLATQETPFAERVKKRMNR